MVYGVGTTHHVKIGDDYFLVRQGSYRKKAAPTFGARFATGDPDFSNLSLWQHWVQHCWIGGFGAETYVDDAMYDDGVGVDTTEHEVMRLARGFAPLTSRSTGNWDLGGTQYAREFVEFNETFYCMVYGSSTESKLWKYSDAAATWSLVHTFGEAVRSVCVWGNRLWFGDGGSNLSYMTTAEAFSYITKPTGRTETPYAMAVFRDRMYVAFGEHIWRLKSDYTWDGSTEFFDAIGVNYITAMETHLGFLYMGSQNGHILRTDGNATYDLWQWDPGTNVTGMRSYDGRLFVTAREYDYDTTAAQGVLYQFTGSAVTELKRWGVAGKDTSTGKLRVSFRRLLFGASNLLGNGSGFGIAAYDALEDGYHIQGSVQDSGGSFSTGTAWRNYIVNDVAVRNGYLFMSVLGHGVFRTPWQWRDFTRGTRVVDVSAMGGALASQAGGWFTSSDFDAGTPGLQKLWREITVHADLPHSTTGIYVEYSIDGGTTWTAAGSMTKTTSATRYVKHFKLDNVQATRFKYRLTLRSETNTKTPSLHSVIVSYLPQPEPNWQWEMHLVMAQDKELLDGTTDDEDVDAVKTRLETAFRDQQLVEFTDIDGTVWASDGPGVLILDYGFDSRYIGPESDGDIEGDVRVVLIETVESYA